MVRALTIPSFSSENFAGVHPEIMSALHEVNTGHTPSYGNDHFTEETIELFKTHFGNDITVYFTFNGTGANNFGLSCITHRFQSIICSDVAHIYIDESTAPEAITGCRLLPVQSENGKMIISDLKEKLKKFRSIHNPQPGVISLTQPTEFGTVYTPHELKEIQLICREHNMKLHIDGTRIFNAAAYMNISLGEMASLCNADVMTIGGTKSGLMFGEAVIFFHPLQTNSNLFNLKRSMQLASKNRFIAAQFKALLQNDLWKKIATHTNSLAAHFEKKIESLPGLQLSYPVHTNAVFLNMEESLYKRLQQYASFYYWNKEKEEARFMFSFNNTLEEVDSFIAECTVGQPELK